MKHMEKIALSGKTGKLADFRHEWKILGSSRRFRLKVGSVSILQIFLNFYLY